MKTTKTIFTTLLIFGAATFMNAQDTKSKFFAFKNIILIPMTSENVMRNQTVLVKDDRIYQIGSVETIDIPKEAFVVDGTGKYLMPGLADMHVHLISKEWETPEANMYLANGVTTIRDLSQGSIMSIKKWCEDYNSKRRLGPTTYNAWTIWGFEPKIQELIPIIKKNNYNCIKLNDYLSRKDFYNVINEAKKSGLYITGHIPYSVNVDDVISAGMDELTHIELLPVVLASNAIKGDKDTMQREVLEKELILNAFRLLEPVYQQNSHSTLDTLHKMLDREIQKLKGKDITIITTLVADETLSLKYNDTLQLKSRPQNKYIPNKFWDDLRQGKDKNSYFIGHEKTAKVFYDLVLYTLKQLRKNKISIVAGTDAGPTFMGIAPGFSLIEELELLVKSGYSPYEALVSSTRDASKIVNKMTGKDDFGTIEIGKKADFILLDKNPMTDITNIRNPLGAMASGTWLPKDKLEQLLAVKRKMASPILREVMTKTNSVDSVLVEYKNLAGKNYLNEYYMTEGTLTMVGYDLIKNNKADDAIKIFNFNSEEYPYAASPYYYLGESYLAKGEKGLAVENFNKALSLDPNYDNAIKALKDLVK
ncbi:MAG: amidohydrolase family protein [Ignavibacteriales bacterium]|nr:amidohydrolase family protein [Ignavibacteriales bacterium]